MRHVFSTEHGFAFTTLFHVRLMIAKHWHKYEVVSEALRPRATDEHLFTGQVVVLLSFYFRVLRLVRHFDAAAW